jgi:FtsP/CotA-like multicopper oxidase with cupredoxin domain
MPQMEEAFNPADAALRAALSRRRFLRGTAAGAATVAAATIAACAPAPPAAWLYQTATPGASNTLGATLLPSGTPLATPTMVHDTPAPSGGPSNDDMDAEMKAVVDRFLGGETAGKTGNQPLAPRIENGVKIFDLAASAFTWQIDAIKPAVNAVGYNGTWPGPLLRLTEGDKVRVNLTNGLDESTGLHFHGQSLPNAMDGVPYITQPPIKPGESFTYEFTAKPAGSHMYHSHHNATDQVGRGMLGAFIVDPLDPAKRYQVDQDVIWISNDALGGFTINGKGFPATKPIVAKLGQRILIRFMNEGVMTHPWHLHGMPMRVVARDGYPLGSAEFTCDTLGVNPGERWDVIITADNPGAWAFHCHILPHAEGPHGMFGMVTALIVQP